PPASSTACCTSSAAASPREPARARSTRCSRFPRHRERLRPTRRPVLHPERSCMTSHHTTATASGPGAPVTGSRLVVAGAPLDNDNRGVEALGTSVVGYLAGAPTVRRVSVLDDGWGIRPDATGTGRVERVGVRNSRRWHRRESWARVRFDQALGGLGNPVVGRFTEADAVADLSGGDSFTDL